MENMHPKMDEAIGDMEHLDLADFSMDDFVANENDGTVEMEIEQTKKELVEIKKEMESIKLDGKSNSKEIAHKLDEKINSLEAYVSEQMLKLAPVGNQQQKEIQLENSAPKKDEIEEAFDFEQHAQNIIKELDRHFDAEDFLIDELEQKEMENEALKKENKILEEILTKMGAEMDALDSGAFRELMVANRESAKLRSELGKMKEENNELKGKMKEENNELKGKMKEENNELKGKMKEENNELIGKMKKLEEEMKIGQWKMGILGRQNEGLCGEMAELKKKNLDLTIELMEEKHRNGGKNKMDENSANTIQQKVDSILFAELKMQQNESLKENGAKLEKEMFKLKKMEIEGKDDKMRAMMKGKIGSLEEEIEIGELKQNEKMEQSSPMKKCSGELGGTFRSSNPFAAAADRIFINSSNINIGGKLAPAMPKPSKMPKPGVWPKPGGWIIN